MHPFLKALLKDLDRARSMIETGIDINKPLRDRQTPLQFAVSQINVPAVQLLLERGADLKRALFFLFYDFKKAGESYYILKLLLGKGADCNEKKSNGQTAFLFALQYASLEYVKLLLDHGADIRTTDIIGKSVLHYTARNPEVDVFEFVSDVCHQEMKSSQDSEDFIDYWMDDLGYSVLHDAAGVGNLVVCELLLKNGAKVNQASYRENDTPLTVAVTYHYVSKAVVQLLLDYGANVNDEADGQSVLQIAILVKVHSDVIGLLIQHMAKMVHLDLSINECDRQIIEGRHFYKEYYDRCLQELQDMKAAKFYHDVSVHEITFIENVKAISGYARNEELVEALERGACENRFPIYFNHFKKEFYIEVDKQRLRRSAAETLSELFKFNDPSHVINQKILDYLNAEDLKFLVM